jgi:hypothetical protein
MVIAIVWHSDSYTVRFLKLFKAGGEAYLFDPFGHVSRVESVMLGQRALRNE